jgi:CHAD domain-containing protein
MKARRVKGLDPGMTLADAAERIVAVRLDELYSFVPRALNPTEVEALHDLRIAAKRLRYVLEVTGPFLGDYATTAAKRARDIQDSVGEIHDCDVQHPEVLQLISELRARDAGELRRAAGEAEDLDPSLSAHTPHRAAYRGLEVLATHLQARRALLFERFLALWDKLERQGFRRKLERAIRERSAPEPPQANGRRGQPPGGGLRGGDGAAPDALRRAVPVRH